ncbi:BamA/OMP85 family outer membrane protein [Fulvivirga sediminis]|uniref:Outer membrane protein assembly factor BamA n=1 Tax=Fulvivirga sediminis TaxID=2803949 RepID=A0A937F3A2_9BACT|nr:POTRA domain-containing protein [Fulvivirga sediminis]MBL3654905.1 outer membrane protein assembly factor BamA [Fulvivirga sediminis]
MKKTLFFLAFIFIIINSSEAQFRRRANAPSDTEGGLNYSNPQEYVIADIQVTGLRVLDKNALISLSGLKVGDKIKVPGDQISGAIRKLWKHGLVGDVSIQIDKIEDDKIYLNIELSERPRLTGFTFEGTKKSKESDLREDLNLIRGRILSDAIIRNTELTVKKYYVDKGYLYADVKVIQQEDTVNRDGVKLRIVVDPKAKVKVNKIDIVGNEMFDDNRIKKKMKKTNERVRISLFKRGAELLVGATKPKNIKSFLDSTYEVSGKELKEFINDNVKLNFFNSTKFIESEYENDKDNIIAFYNSHGYRDAEIVRDSVYANNENSVNIDIEISEGRKYYFRNIIWTGNFVYDDATLDKVLAIEKGDVYNKELIDKKLSFNPKGTDISGLYMDDGYLFFRVNPVEVAVEGDSIDVEMRIYEGEQATIKNVIIAGNERTRDHVIRRELYTIPGRKFSRSDLIRTQQMLSQLGYFDPEQINPVPKPNPADGTVDIEWNLVERSSDQIELSGGWGGQLGFVGTLGLSLNNFSMRNLVKGKFNPIPTGDGQKLSMRVQATGRQYQNYSVSFTEPWLGGKKPNSFTVSANYSIQRARQYEDRDGDGVSEYIPPYGKYNAHISVKGITVGLGKRLRWPDDYFTWTNSLSYMVYGLDNYRFSGLDFANGSANSIAFNSTISRNSVNSPMYPTGGSTISLSASFTPPYSLWRDIDYEKVEASERYKWIEYHKWMFDSKYYLTVVGKLVLEAKAHFGFIGSYSSEAGIGPFERFNLGGDGLAGQNFVLGTDVIGLRGYQNNALTPPYDRTIAQNGTGRIEGGIVYDKFGLELRYPVTTGQAATIYGFVFAEAGNNFDNYQEFNPFENYRSAGFGARIFMPAFGLIGINWGYGFDTVPGDTERSGPQFHFTIGQQIR